MIEPRRGVKLFKGSEKRTNLPCLTNILITLFHFLIFSLYLYLFYCDVSPPGVFGPDPYKRCTIVLRSAGILNSIIFMISVVHCRNSAEERTLSTTTQKDTQSKSLRFDIEKFCYLIIHPPRIFGIGAPSSHMSPNGFDYSQFAVLQVLDFRLAVFRPEVDQPPSHRTQATPSGWNDLREVGIRLRRHHQHLRLDPLQRFEVISILIGLSNITSLPHPCQD